VASRGYLLVPGRQSDPAFFPLYPLLLRLGHAGAIGYRTGGIVLANAALPAALLVLYELSRRLLSEPIARRAACYAAVFPAGFAFSMAYPQSLTLLAVAAAALLAVERRFVWSAAAAAAATLLRPEGVFVCLPIAALVWRAWPGLRQTEQGRALAAVAAGPLALLTYPLYLSWALKDSGAWSEAQQAWGRSFSATGLVHVLYELPSKLQLNPWLIRDVVAVVIYAILLIAAARAGVPRAWLAAALLVLAVPLMSGSVESEARLGLLALPLYWGLAALGSTRPRDLTIRGICAGLLLAGTLTLPFIFP